MDMIVNGIPCDSVYKGLLNDYDDCSNENHCIE